MISSYFNDLKAAENFLETLDFSSAERLQAGIQINGVAACSLDVLDENEREFWWKINEKYLSEGIKLFAKAEDIKNNPEAAEIMAKLMEDVQQSNLPPAEELKKITDIINLIQYPEEEQYQEFAKLCHRYNISEALYIKTIREVLPNLTQQDDLPDIKFSFDKIDMNVINGQNPLANVTNGQYSVAKLPKGDLRGLFLGKYVNDCQFIGGHSEQCAIEGMTRLDAGFFVITDNQKKI